MHYIVVQECIFFRNEELQHAITMNMSNCYKEMLSDTSELLQELEESDGSFKEVWMYKHRQWILSQKLELLLNQQ